MDRFIKQVEKVWTPSMVNTVSTWLDDLERIEDKQPKGRRAFNQWKPFKVYSSITLAKHVSPVFSLRFKGQEVAEVKLDRQGQANLVLSKRI